MGCGNIINPVRTAATPAYQQILIDIFDLIPLEEQRLKFSKRAEIQKYYDEFQWTMSSQINQLVNMLIQHIESYKIRLVDSAIYIENKIVIYNVIQKLTQNPVIIKISIQIISEMIQNLHKFIQTIQPEEDQQSEHLQTLTYISDNFLRFELTFSSILSYLINCKQQYSWIWFPIVLRQLEMFSQKSQKQFQSENIQSILAFLEYILGVSLTNKDQFESLFQSPDDQTSVQELISSQKDINYILNVYQATLSMIPFEKVFQTKNQRQLCIILMRFLFKHEDSDTWKTTLNTLISRAINLKQFDELFLMAYNNMDEDTWYQFDQIHIITKTILNVSRQCDQITAMEIFLISRFIDYLQLTTSGSPQRINVSTAVKLKVLRIIKFIFQQLTSNQFILFQQGTILKALLINLRNHFDDDVSKYTSQNIHLLLTLIQDDSTSYYSFISQLFNFTYNCHLQLQQGNSTENLLMKLLTFIEDSIIKMPYPMQIRDDYAYMIMEICDCHQFTIIHCTQIILEVANANFIISGDVLTLCSYFIVKVLLSDESLANKFSKQFMQFIAQNTTSIPSLILYLIDDKFRNHNFDEYPNKTLRLALILDLQRCLKDEYIHECFYSVYGASYLSLGINSKQAFQTLGADIKVNDIMTRIFEKLQSHWVDFETLRGRMKIENIERIIDLEEIHIQEDAGKEMYQSFQAPSLVEVLDEDFDKVLQQIRKGKIRTDL